MSDFSLKGGGSDALEAGLNLTSTILTTLTGNATADTVGSYVELVSAANNDRPINKVIIQVAGNSSSIQGQAMINIAIGAAASEQDIIANLFVVTPTGNNAEMITFDFPINIPSGVRISANCQTHVGSRITTMSLILCHGSIGQEESLNTVDTIGANAGVTEAVTVNAGGTVNTFGSWTEMTASTAEAYKGFLVAACKVNGSWTSMNLTYEVGVGAAASEETIFSGQFMKVSDTEYGAGLATPFIPVGISSGTRIAIRSQASAVGSGDEHFDFVIYGVR